MCKIYFTYNELKKDIYHMKNSEIIICDDIEITINKLPLYEMKRLKKYINDNNINFKIYVPPFKRKKSVWEK